VTKAQMKTRIKVTLTKEVERAANVLLRKYQRLSPENWRRKNLSNVVAVCVFEMLRAERLHEKIHRRTKK